jgi:large subunit ribosomal protein L23
MQALGLTFRRLYSTKSSSTLPDIARVARSASAPHAVRLRRKQKLGERKLGESDSTTTGLTPTEKIRYERLKATGKLGQIDGQPLTEEQWITRVNTRRARIRGVKTVKNHGVEETQVVGQRVYLPNIVLTLVRNNTPPGEAYNPYEATFRIPKSVTKTDLRSLLASIYGVKTTYIRTDNYIAPLNTRRKLGISDYSYKRAVVGLVDPFYYPQRLEDMTTEEQTERKQWLDQHFRVTERRDQRNTMLRIVSMANGIQPNRLPEIREPRKKMLERILARREKRESLVKAQVQEWQRKREAGETITLEKS